MTASEEEKRRQELQKIMKIARERRCHGKYKPEEKKESIGRSRKKRRSRPLKRRLRWKKRKSRPPRRRLKERKKRSRFLEE